MSHLISLNVVKQNEFGDEPMLLNSKRSTDLGDNLYGYQVDLNYFGLPGYYLYLVLQEEDN